MKWKGSPWKSDLIGEWQSWFAWRPVKMQNGNWIWWEQTEKRYCEGGTGELGFYIYQDPKNRQKH